MTVNHWKNWHLALMLVSLAPLAAAADDQESDGKEQGRKTVIEDRSGGGKKIRVVVGRAGKNWLGVHAVPVDDALKAQLGLKDRMIIHHVIPESPAAKAGLQVHDIVLKLGDREISNLDELMRTVSDLGEQEVRIVVLRKGKETNFTVKAGERPADGELERLVPKIAVENVEKEFPWKLHHEIGPGKEFIWRAIGPGVLDGSAVLFDSKFEFPDGLSISISKEKDQPTKITIKRDGQTYETTMDRLNELPKDVAAIVSRLMAGHKAHMLIGPDGKSILKEKILKEKDKAFEQAKKAGVDAGRAGQRIEVLRSEEGTLNDLRKAVDALRQEVQQLREASKSDRKAN